MKTIVFEGYLHDLYPDGITLEADSPAEALYGLQNYPGFRKEDDVLYQVTLPDFPSRDAIYNRTDRTEIRVVPVLEGAGGKMGGIFQILIGVLMIVGSFFLIPINPYLAAGVALSGAAMILGGIMSFLMPVPKASSVASDERSKYIPANKNTVKVGTPIPILFGRRKVYGHFLSFDVDAKSKEESEVPVPTSPPTTKAMAVSVSPGGAVIASFKDRFNIV